MVVRLKLMLEQTEYSALLRMARTELRSPADQLRYILRFELDRLGLLPQGETAIPPEKYQGEGIVMDKDTGINIAHLKERQ